MFFQKDVETMKRKDEENECARTNDSTMPRHDENARN